ncbi:MAG: glycoside hydrolase family 28 protein [Sedimentisphaerales bacterium]
MKEKREHFFSVADFGATGNGKTNDAFAIQAAVDACAKSGGGKVYFGPGNYLTGTILLKSNVCLYLEAGATITGSADFADYLPDSYCRTVTKGALFLGQNLKNLTVEGRGSIDGNGCAFWESEYCNETALKPKLQRPSALFLIADSENIIFRDITIKNSPCYTLWIFGCDKVKVSGITIDNPLNGPNTDAIDIDCCSNVCISDCHISAGDDCIALKSDAKRLGRNKECKNIVVCNCTLRSSTCAIRVGYEGDEAIKNCVFSNLIIYDSSKGIDIISILPDLPMPLFTEINEGPRIEGLIFSDIVMENVKSPIFIWQGKEVEGVFKGKIENIKINNIIAKSQQFCFIGGISGSPIRDISLTNVKIIIQGTNKSSEFEVPCVWGGDKIPWGIYCRHIKGFILNDVNVEFEQNAANWLGVLKCEEVEDIDINALRCKYNLKNSEIASIVLANCRNSFIHNCNQLSEVNVFLKLEGRSAKSIKLSSNNLICAKKAVDTSQEVDV